MVEESECTKWIPTEITSYYTNGRFEIDYDWQTYLSIKVWPKKRIYFPLGVKFLFVIHYTQITLSACVYMYIWNHTVELLSNRIKSEIIKNIRRWVPIVNLKQALPNYIIIHDQWGGFDRQRC
jgi:hypothetical protein